MKNNGNRPVQDEFRSSQVYKTLTGYGIPVANKIAQGLGKAAEGLDSALNGFAGNGPNNGQNGAPNVPKGYYQNYRQGPNGPQGQPAAPGQQGRPPVQGQQPYQAAQGNPQAAPGSRQAAPGAAPQPPYQAQQRPVPPPPPPKGKKGYYQYQYSAQSQNNRTGYTSQTARPNVPPQYQAQQPGPAANVRPPQGVAPAPPPQMKLVHKGSAAKFYITGVTALLYALSFPMYEPMHFAIFAVVEVCIFLLSGALFRGKKQFVPVEPVKPKEEPKKEEEEKPSKTGNPEVDKIIEEGSVYLKKLRAANDAIPDESLSECIDRMERSSADIFRYIADHPEKAPQIRKFMNYYLPTTLKLLSSYQRLSSQSVKGENITSTMFNIAGMMHTVADAFEKQLDSLFTDEAMDISADISVFETLLKSEGFVEENKK